MPRAGPTSAWVVNGRDPWHPNGGPNPSECATALGHELGTDLRVKFTRPRENAGLRYLVEGFSLRLESGRLGNLPQGYQPESDYI